MPHASMYAIGSNPEIPTIDSIFDCANTLFPTKPVTISYQGWLNPNAFPIT